MAMVRTGITFDRTWIERIILQLADTFDIQVEWSEDTTAWAGALALLGGLVGGIAMGRMGAALGAGIGGVAGVGVSNAAHLREIWSTIQDKLEELLFIVFNYLRKLNVSDYARAIEFLMANISSRRELAYIIIDVLAETLGKTVISNITVA